jgi:hypothetical protein
VQRLWQILLDERKKVDAYRCLPEEDHQPEFQNPEAVSMQFAGELAYVDHPVPHTPRRVAAP